MIKSILLAMDGSEHAWAAWQYAMDLGRAHGAAVRVVSVADTRVPFAGAVAPVGDFTAIEAYGKGVVDKMEADQAALLFNVKQKSESANLNIEYELLRGAPGEVICSFDALVDLIVMGHRGRRSLLDRYLALGSVAEEVVRKSTRPVLLAPDRYVPMQRILAAYDGSGPAKHMLHWAAGLAVTLNRAIGVVTVHRHPEVGESLLREAREYLKPYGLEALTVLRRGAIADEILATANDTGAGLIAMGAHGHSRIREAILGSVTETMLQRMDRPLLMTR